MILPNRSPEMGGLRQKNYKVVVFRPISIGSCTQNLFTATLFSLFVWLCYGFDNLFISGYGRVCVGFGIVLSCSELN